MRRPRRLLASALSAAVTTFGLVAVLIVNLTGWSLGPRVEQATVIVSVMLVILAAVNAVFVAWATAIETRRPAALMRALGATPAQVTAGPSLAQLGPAFLGVLVCVPGPILLYLRGGRLSTVVPVLPLASIVVATLVAIGVLTALTTLAASRGQVAEALEVGRCVTVPVAGDAFRSTLHAAVQPKPAQHPLQHAGLAAPERPRTARLAW